MVLKAENKLVDVLEEAGMFGQYKKYRIRDANNKKAPTRVVLDFALREVSEEDETHIVYLWTDEETGEVHTLKLSKDFIKSVRENVHPGITNSVTTKEVIARMGKEDTDSQRRQFRAAVAYWQDRGLLICSNSKGYFIATSHEELDSCVSNKERQARANLNRAAFLRSMSIEDSLKLYSQGVTNEVMLRVA